MKSPHTSAKNVLVLQGGGALGAYQAGAYSALSEAKYEPDWIAGISIGAINTAIIAGNPAKHRAEKLRTFWEQCSGWLVAEPVSTNSSVRSMFTDWAASMVMLRGVPGFFTPRFPGPQFLPNGSIGATSFYDTRALRDTLNRLIDFEYLNSGGPRLSIGAVNVETGNFAYFDSATTEIRPNTSWQAAPFPPVLARLRLMARFIGMVVWFQTRHCNSCWKTQAPPL